MSAGKASGQNREYQVTCRDLLMRREPDLTSYDDDGIDVAFEAGGTTWTLDVALKYSSGRLLVAECRRVTSAIKQEALAAFSKKLDLLRQLRGASVAGVFFAKCLYQRGALKFAAHEQITLASVSDSEPCRLYFCRWDAGHRTRKLDAVVFLPSIPSGATLFAPSVSLGPEGPRGRRTRS